METLRDLRKWAGHIGKFSSVDDIEEVEGSIFCQTEDDADYGTIRFRIYTDNNVYTIHANCHQATGAGVVDGKVSTKQVSLPTYLGCGASARKPRAGETWTRGSDLADGPLTFETWVKILGDIVSYEQVKVHKPRTGGQTYVENPNAPFGAAGIGPSKEN